MTASGNPRPRQTALTWILITLEVFVAIGAVPVGILFIVSPAGFDDGATLVGTPFDSYLIPGIVLFLANGVLPLVTAIGAAARTPWSRYLHPVVGAVLTGWIGVQVLLIGFNSPLQPVYGILGLVILLLGLLHFRQSAPR